MEKEGYEVKIVEEIFMKRKHGIKRILILLLALLPIMSCGDSSDDSTAEVRMYQLVEARTLWQSHGITDYVVTQSYFCAYGCPPRNYYYKVVVKGNEVVDVLDLQDDTSLEIEDRRRFLTIDESFEGLESTIWTQPATFKITYNSIFGYPEYIYIFQGDGRADDGGGRTLSDLSIE